LNHPDEEGVPAYLKGAPDRFRAEFFLALECPFVNLFFAIQPDAKSATATDQDRDWLLVETIDAQ
jgi:hypothetical protein